MVDKRVRDMAAASALSGGEKFYADDGASDVYVTGNQIRTFCTASGDSLNITDAGAVGDDATINTTAIQSTLDSGEPRIYIPDGIFRTGQLLVPITVKEIFGPGTLKYDAAPNAIFIYVDQADGLVIRDISIDVDPAVHTFNTCIWVEASSGTCEDVCIQNVNFKNSGTRAIRLGKGTINCGARNCVIKNFNFNAFHSEDTVAATRPTRNYIIDCLIDTDATEATTHKVIFEGGSYGRAINNRLFNTTPGTSTGMGILFSDELQGQIIGNRITDNVGESIQYASESRDINGFSIVGNIITWENGVGVANDLCIDVVANQGGTGSTISGGIVADNDINATAIGGAAGGGIALFGCVVDCMIANNLLVDTQVITATAILPAICSYYNPVAAVDPTSPQRNKFIGNKIVSNTGLLEYGIAEQLQSAGSFSGGSEYINNTVKGETIAEYSLVAPNSIVSGVSHMTIQPDNFGGSNTNAAQPVFNSQHDAITLGAATLYEVEGQYIIARSAGTTAHSTSILFGVTSALTSLRMIIQCTNGDDGVLTALNQVELATATGIAVTGSNSSASERLLIKFRGFIVTNSTTIVTPQFQYSVAPGAAPNTLSSSYIRFMPRGAPGMTFNGPWA